jgi:hypothetical protein
LRQDVPRPVKVAPYIQGRTRTVVENCQGIDDAPDARQVKSFRPLRIAIRRVGILAEGSLKRTPITQINVGVGIEIATPAVGSNRLSARAGYAVEERSVVSEIHNGVTIQIAWIRV